MYATLLINPTDFIVYFYNKEDNPKAQGLAERCYQELPDKKRRGLEFLEKQRQTSLFTQLEIYLQNGQWREADEETTRLMLLIAKREDEGWLDVESIENFPCEELRTLDKLWVDYSKGEFGFSVQKKVWIACGGVPGEYDWDVYEKFADQVGWRRSGDWLSYDELTFLLDGSEKAHLPCLWGGTLMGGWGMGIDYEKDYEKVKKYLNELFVGNRGVNRVGWRMVLVISFLAQRLVTCNISQI